MIDIIQAGGQIGALIMSVLHDTYNDFLRSRKLAGLSKKSITCYRDFLRPFLDFCGHDLPLERLSYALITDYIDTIYSRNLSRSTIATYISHIRVYLRWLENFYGVDLKTRMIRIPKKHKKLVHIYTDSEILEIYNNIKTSVPWLTIRNKLIISLMLDSGLRQNEVCTLLMKNVILVERKIKVVGKGGKERLVPIGELTVHFFKEYFLLCPYQESKQVFVSKDGSPLTTNSVKLLVSKIAKKLDFEFSSHKLRHNFGTNYCLNQYDKFGQIDIYKLMVIMGHEEIETTRRYLHLANEIIVARSNISHLDKIFNELK